MNFDLELLNRAQELSRRAYLQGFYTRTSFLTQGEAALLSEMKPAPCFFGGYEEAERRVAVFGSLEEFGFEWESDIVILKIEPKSQKFADTLSHRDFLGAILNLGIKRELLGDILVFENVGYLFVLEQIASYVIENLLKVKHTAVKVSLCPSLPEGAGVTFLEKEVVGASNRLDALISAVWNLSRTEGKKLVEGEMVSVSGKVISDPSKEVPFGARVSVRGYGRFYFDGEKNKTQKGRSRMLVRIFQ